MTALNLVKSPRMFDERAHFSRIVSVVLRHRTNFDKGIEQDIFNGKRNWAWLTEKKVNIFSKTDSIISHLHPSIP